MKSKTNLSPRFYSNAMEEFFDTPGHVANRLSTAGMTIDGADLVRARRSMVRSFCLADLVRLAELDAGVAVDGRADAEGIEASHDVVSAIAALNEALRRSPVAIEVVPTTLPIFGRDSREIARLMSAGA